MNLEAQLLNIIEEQQNQLKQQQQEQEKALQLIQQQSGTIEQLKSYTNTLNSKHQEAVKIVQKYQQFVQERSEETISADRATAIRAEYLNNFVTDFTRQFASTATSTIERFSAELADRQSSQKSGIEDYSASSRIGDQQSIETTSRTNHRENEFSRAVSAEISSINPTSVIKALDVLDQRKELQREQERQRSRDYDSPSPF